MGTASDRARLRSDLKELAKLAAPEPTPTPHEGFATADSSGFVDLSAFSASDDSSASLDGWVERELARAGGRTQAGAVLTAGSMAPVAMSSLLGPQPIDADPVPRKRGWAYTALGLAGAAVVAVLAVAISRHHPPSASNVAEQVAAPAAAPPVRPAIAATAADPVAPSSVAAVAASAPLQVAVTSPDPTPTSRKHTSTRWHGTAAAAAPAAAPVAVATRPAQPAAAKVAIPAPKSGGGDSLMDLMRASINAPKK